MSRATKIKAESVLSKDDRKASQGYVDIKKKSKEELEELRERQNKLLLNRLFIQKLPDKGQKLILFKTELENELKKREEEYNATCNLLNKLTLNESEDIEWSEGKLRNNVNCAKPLDSDDEDDKSDVADPLKLVATHSGTARGNKIIHQNSGDSNGSQKLFYVDKFCNKYGSANKTDDRFIPNQLKNNDKDLFVKSAEKVKEKFGEKWEVTQATPPVPVFKDTIMISLSESLKLQKVQAEKLKEIEKKFATERLLRNIGVKIGEKLPVTNVKEYRTEKDNVESVEDEEETEENESDSEDAES